MDKLYCPGCKISIQGKKYQIINCKCGKTLMIIDINKKLLIEDVTKKEGEK